MVVIVSALQDFLDPQAPLDLQEGLAPLGSLEPPASQVKAIIAYDMHFACNSNLTRIEHYTIVYFSKVAARIPAVGFPSIVPWGMHVSFFNRDPAFLSAGFTGSTGSSGGTGGTGSTGATGFTGEEKMHYTRVSSL